MGSLRIFGTGACLLVAGAVRLAVKNNAESLPVTNGLIVDLRGDTGITSTAWDNQVDGQPDGVIGAGVVYNSNEKAFRFTRGGNIILLPISTTPTRTPAVTYSAWAKPLAHAGEDVIWIVAQSPALGGNRALGLDDTFRDPAVVGGPYAFCPSYVHGAFNAPALALNVWHHVAAVYNHTAVTIYVDGTQYTYPHTCSSPDPADDSHVQLAIGGREHGVRSGDMWITDVAVYNRALEPSELTALYTAGRHHPSSVHASGDPHCKNLRGELFDIFATGNLTMLQVPRRGIAPGGDLLVKANIVPIDNKVCAPTIIDQLDIHGAWLQGMPPLRLVPGPGGIPPLPSEWLQGGDLKAHIKSASNGQASLRISLGGHLSLVVKQHAGPETGIKYLDLNVQGLAFIQEEVGGLLGLDRHDLEAAQAPGCGSRAATQLYRLGFQHEQSSNARLLSNALVEEPMGNV